MIFIIKFTI